MEKIEVIKRISNIIERDLKSTDDLDLIANNIYEDLQQQNIIGNSFTQRFGIETTNDDSTELPKVLSITTPMFKGTVYLRNSGSKYWYENSEGGTVLAVSSKKIMLAKIRKYT